MKIREKLKRKEKRGKRNHLLEVILSARTRERRKEDWKWEGMGKVEGKGDSRGGRGEKVIGLLLFELV